MSADGKTDDEIRTILQSVKTIALLGASPNPDRPSNRVMKFLLGRGYEVIPVNPGQTGKTLHGQLVYGRLADIPRPIDMVDVFRAADALPEIVTEAASLTPRPAVLWGQLEVVHEGAAAEARKSGIDVVMDRCPAIEIPRLGL